MKPQVSLGRLQAQFARALLGDEDPAPTAQLGGDPGIARRRFAIYRRAVVANRSNALQAAFPVVARLVGEAFFAEAARRHGLQSPPGCADLNRYGDAFPAFLAAYPPARALPWLADVARIEWARQEALMASDVPGFDFGALARIDDRDQPAMRFSLHPSVRMVRSPWPVFAIWEANQPDRDGTPERDEGGDDVLVWREDQRVRVALLAPREAVFVDGLRRGLSLEKVAEVAGEWDFGEMLRRLAAHGMLAGFATGLPPDP